MTEAPCIACAHPGPHPHVNEHESGWLTLHCTACGVTFGVYRSDVE